MVKTNLQIIFTSWRVRDPNATSSATTMLLASTTLMIRKSDPGTGSVHYYIAPLTLLPSGHHSALSPSKEYRRIMRINKIKAKEAKTDEGLKSYLVPRRELHWVNNLHIILKSLFRRLPKTPMLTKGMALPKMRYLLFLRRRLIILKMFSPNRKSGRKAH